MLIANRCLVPSPQSYCAAVRPSRLRQAPRAALTASPPTRNKAATLEQGLVCTMVVGRGLRPAREDRREHCALILIGRHLNLSISDSPFQRLSKASVRRTWGHSHRPRMMPLPPLENKLSHGGLLSPSFRLDCSRLFFSTFPLILV